MRDNSELIGNLADKIANMAMDEIAKALGTEEVTSAEIVNITATSCARVVAASLIGNLKWDVLNAQECDDLIESFVNLFKTNCKSVRQYRLATPDKETPDETFTCACGYTTTHGQLMTRHVQTCNNASQPTEDASVWDK